MTRKFLSLILALALVFSLAACSGSDSKEPEVSTSPEVGDDVTTSPDIPESEAPESEAPESEAPESAAPESSAPESSAPVESTQPSAEPSVEPSVEPTPSPDASEEPEESDSVCTDIYNSIVAQLGSDLPSFMSCGDSDLSGLYGIDASLLNDYSLNIPLMVVHASEIFIAEVADGNMDAVKAGIESRKQALLDSWSQYLPDQYELVQNAKIVENGNYIIFVVADDPDAIVDIFNAALAA